MRVSASLLFVVVAAAPLVYAECPIATSKARADYDAAITAENDHDSKTAISAYRRVLSLEPGNWCVVMDLAAQLKEAGDVSAAVALYRGWLNDHPEGSDLYENLIDLLNDDRHDPLAAIEACREWLHHADTNISHRTCGTLLMQENRLDEAISEFQKALRWSDGPLENRFLAAALEKKGLFEKAAARYRRAIDKHPQGIDEHYDLADLLRKIGDVQGAITEYRAATSLRPDDALVHDWLGDLYIQVGDNASAQGEYRKAIKAQSWDEYAHYRLASLLQSAGDSAGATAESEAARAACLDRSDVKNDFDCHHVLAVDAWRVHKDETTAREEWRAVLRERPNDPSLHIGYGRMLAEADRTREAVAEYRIALRGGRGEAVWYAEFGALLKKVKLSSEAREAFRAAYELDPTNSTFRKRYEQLKSH